MITKLSIPAVSALRSTDASVIRQIVLSISDEIDKLNQKIDDMENSRKNYIDNKNNTKDLKVKSNGI